MPARLRPPAQAGITFDLVSTSAARLDVVVAAEHGRDSLAALRLASGL